MIFQKIKTLRREIVERLQLIVKVAKERKIQEMNCYVGEIYQRVCIAVIIFYI